MRTLLKGECHATPWTPWSPCEGKCGAKSTVKRTRQILHRPHERHLPRGEPCPHGEVDEKPCKVRCLNGQPVSSAGAAAASASSAKEAKKELKGAINLASTPPTPAKEVKKEEPVESGKTEAPNAAPLPTEPEPAAQGEARGVPAEAAEDEEEAEELAV